MSDQDKIRGAERAADGKGRTQGVVAQVTSSAKEIADHNEGYDKATEIITDKKIAEAAEKGSK